MTHHDAPRAQQPPASSSTVDATFITSTAVHAGLTAAAALLSAAAVLASLTALTIEAASSGAASSGAATVTNGVELADQLWQLLLVLTALPFSGQLRAGFESVGGFFTSNGEGVTLGVWPLASLAFVVLSSSAAAYLLERRRPLESKARRLASSAAAACVFAAFILVLAVPGVRFGSMGAVTTISALTPQLVVIAFVAVFASAWLGRSLAVRDRALPMHSGVRTTRQSGVVRRLVADAGIFAAGLAVVGALLTVVALTVIFVEADARGAVLPALLAAAPHIVFATLILGHLGVLTLSVPYSGSEALSVFSPELPFAWLALVLVVVASLCSALVIGVGRVATRTPRWTVIWRLPVVVLAVWTVIATVFLPVTLEGSAAVFGFSLGDFAFGARPAFWTPALFAAWALAVELAAWALPNRVAAVAARVHAVAVTIRRGFGVSEVPGAVTWGTSAARGPQMARDARFESLSAPSNSGGGTPSISTPQDQLSPRVPPRSLGPLATSRLRRAGVLTGVLALLVTGMTVGVSTANAGRGAAAEVREYVDAIASGEASRASELVDPNIETSLREYVSDDMLASATERITVLDVAETEDSPQTPDAGWFTEASQSVPSTARETQNVRVTYRLGGITESAVLVAERRDNEFLVLERWRIMTPLIFESAVGSSHSMEMTVGSAAVTPGPVESVTWEGSQPVSWVPFSAYPAIYPVTGTSSSFYSVAVEPVRVGSPVEGSVPERNVVYTPTEELIEAVNASVRTRVDECALSSEGSPDGCPFSAYVSGQDKTVIWQVTSYPTVAVSQTSNRFEMKEGTVSYTYTGFGGRAATGSDTIWGAGSYVVDGETVTVEFR